jgi:hypothetical protein
MNLMSNHSGLKYIQDQIQHLLGSLSEETYTRNLEILGNVSISKHLRHVYEFYQLVADASINGRLDYSLRQRNKDFENSIAIAQNHLEMVFHKISSADITQEIIVINEELDGLSVSEHKSSMGREMMYAFDHAIHHLAIIKIGAFSMNIQLPKSFGVAPSTLNYQNQQ